MTGQVTESVALLELVGVAASAIADSAARPHREPQEPRRGCPVSRLCMRSAARSLRAQRQGAERPRRAVRR